MKLNLTEDEIKRLLGWFVSAQFADEHSSKLDHEDFELKKKLEDILRAHALIE